MFKILYLDLCNKLDYEGKDINLCSCVGVLIKKNYVMKKHFGCYANEI